MNTYRPTRRDAEGNLYYLKDIREETPYYNKKMIDAKPCKYVNHNTYLIHIYKDEYTAPFIHKIKEPYEEYSRLPYYINTVIDMDYQTDIYNIWKLEEKKV